MRTPEQRSIISGIGISRIGRRTGIPGLELTEEASRAAIEDAGLEPSDLDGVATLGDIPADEVRTAQKQNLHLASCWLVNRFD